jgi:parallel beta-helix repeat protein
MQSVILRRRKRLLWKFVLTIALIIALLAWAIDRFNIPPRRLGPYIERRAAGHNPVIVGVGKWIGEALTVLDRGRLRPLSTPPLVLGAQADEMATSVVAAIGQVIIVNSAEQAVHAMAQARPGDAITFLPGTYRFKGKAITAAQAGTKTSPIIVRAARPGTVMLEFAMSEGFHVSAPYWRFENLTIQGVCAHHSDCDHAFHVVGKATNFIARNNVIADFNAHFKINGDGINFPDYGLIEANTLTNASVRNTAHPVTPIDLVAASNWSIRKNLISDFIKGQGDRISYGGFAKGAGASNRFESNIVLCEQRLRGAPGQRVGLSLGNGGTGKAFCRDKRCITEQDGGIIQSNLIASCSDEGIYVNRSAGTKILHNTLIDTAGIMVRFAESSADVEGNLVDGVIRSGSDSILRAADNYTTNMVGIYLGWRPVRNFYRQADERDLAWKRDPPRRNAADITVPDLCGSPRPSRLAYGAFENFSACLSSPHLRTHDEPKSR